MFRLASLTTVAAGLALAGMIYALSDPKSEAAAAKAHSLFQTADGCMACHNGLVTPSGEDVSIGFDWRASMMANSSRDPYWQASVRREIMDHPRAQEGIEDECSKCHMPMARFEAKTSGRKGTVFAHLPLGTGAVRSDRLAGDGVSCTICHQITDAGFGTRESFVGGFSVDTSKPKGERAIYGPFRIDLGRTTIMRSATGFKQTESTHIQKSELCATCHTLYTKALDSNGDVAGELPEQVPFQEWLHSSYRGEKSCQDCHMPVVKEPAAITAVLGEPREGFSRHDFRGGNFFVLKMLDRFRSELAVEALPTELELAARKTRDNLQNETARVSVDKAEVRGDRLQADVSIVNLTGHKLPTAYPSRRAWLHATVRDANGRVLFESGALAANGQIQGNDHDAAPTRYEPHYEEIRRDDEVQIYESIMVDSANAVTTGLLSALRYIKDNRLLPKGFDKATAGQDIAVHGSASGDASFVGGSDQVRYIVNVAGATGPFVVEAELWYQPIGYRWAQNLGSYDAGETKRFLQYYESMAASAGIILARNSATAR